MKRNIGEFVSGKIGNVVFVSDGRSSYVRAAPNRKKNSWSELQLLYRQRMSRAAALWRSFKSEKINKIWAYASKHANSYAYFIQRNMESISIDGTVFYPGKFFASDGNLVQLGNLTAVQYLISNSIVDLNWKNDPHFGPVRLNDSIYIIGYYESHFSKLVKTDLLRSDLQGNVTLPYIKNVDISDFQDYHLYVFTGASDESAFSSSQHFVFSSH